MTSVVFAGILLVVMVVLSWRNRHGLMMGALGVLLGVTIVLGHVTLGQIASELGAAVGHVGTAIAATLGGGR